MYKRATGVFCVILLLMSFVMFRIYTINLTDYITMAAAVQGKYELNISSTRGMIYDRNFQGLVNQETYYVASVMPTPQAASALLEDMEDESARQAMMERLSASTPFTAVVEDFNIYADGVNVYKVPARYGSRQLAPHIVGYLGGDAQGAAGIEKSYDQLLRETGGEISVLYQMDATGRAMESNTIGVVRENYNNLGGVVLTLDADIQDIAQQALEAGCDRGAAVVMDIHNGDILAMASIPAYDPGDVAASLDREDAPFINRATSGYNIGSVFKIVVSAAALESGYSRYTTYECEGYIDVGGQIFRCNNHAVHGEVDMQRALEVSCNTYFINLAQELEPRQMLALCQNLGLNTAAELAPGLTTQPGNLPEAEDFRNPAALANFAFGQGTSLATPLQMAQIVSAIANNGSMVTPRLVMGTTEDGRTLTAQNASYAANQVLNPKTSATLQELMVGVVEQGSGRPALPAVGSAGGKTSSAQTGQFVEGEDGEEKEIVHAWFVGFYPADEPRYSIVVFVEGGESGERVAAPIFKQLVDGIAGLPPSATAALEMP